MDYPLGPDLAPLLDAASDFASYLGTHTEASVREFLDRFPLPLIFSALQDRADEPMLEPTLISSLDRIFKTKYGASLVPQYVHFVQAGLKSNSQRIRCLTCRAVCSFLETTDNHGSAIGLIKEYDIYHLLLKCLLEGNEEVANNASDAIKSLAMFHEGVAIIFPRNVNEATHLKMIATRCSSLARVRILGLIAKMFSLSVDVASVIYDSNLLSLFEAEVGSTNDMLVTLSALELFYELAESPHGTRFLLKTSLLQLLSSLISNSSIDSVLRSRALLSCGRLLSADDTYSVVDENSVRASILAINGRLELLKFQDTDEHESALEALGHIGTSIQGATLLLMCPSPVARHIVESAFSRQQRGIILAALDTLGNISGVNRTFDSMLLGSSAEECLRHLIYMMAANSSKLTPSGLFLSVLRQEPEIRLAAYKLISALVARQWCLIEICSKQEIINIIVDANIETNKSGMDARYSCCMAICKALSDLNMLNDPALSVTAEKLQQAVKRGPYLPKRVVEPKPLVVTADRF